MYTPNFSVLHENPPTSHELTGIGGACWRKMESIAREIELKEGRESRHRYPRRPDRRLGRELVFPAPVTHNTLARIECLSTM